MSWVCKVIGGFPAGAEIVGASPTLAVTVGIPDADVSVTLSFPPHAVSVVIVKRTAVAIARYFFARIVSLIQVHRLV